MMVLVLATHHKRVLGKARCNSYRIFKITYVVDTDAIENLIERGLPTGHAEIEVRIGQILGR